MTGKRAKLVAALFAGVAGMAAPTSACAQGDPTYEFDLAPQSLGNALRAVTARAGWELYAKADEVNDVDAPALSGKLTPREAIERLLAGTDLRASFDGTAVIIRGQSGDATATRDAAENTEIIVTGTHIRAGETMSPLISRSREAMEVAGIANLGDFIRTLPQNFTGGQNPGLVGGGNQGGNENLNASSALNLRGLGPDATLTLINDHRVAYDGAAQGVDISAIPLAAVEKVEIVPDGASALYGSDAVGGVANIILRRAFDGAQISARLGATTDGGGWEQQYDLVTGARWHSGGVMFAATFNRTDAILARQRSFTRSLSPDATLLPYQRQYAFVLNGSQQVTDNLRFLLDAQFSRRNSEQAIAATATTPPSTDGVVSRPDVQTYSISPLLRLDLNGGWRLSLGGTIGESDTDVPSQTARGGTIVTRTRVRYGNRLRIVEANAEGPLLSLPAGDIRLAVGAGYRTMSFAAKATVAVGGMTITPLDVAPDQDVLYGFGELSVPLVGSSNAVPLVDTLRLSAALRYESYAKLDKVASPKIALTYKPIPDVSLQASWGRSFKAPTFYQRYRGFQTILYPSTNFGGDDPGRTALYVAGGNPDLQPERARTWTASLIVEPRTISGLRLDAGYFNIKYRNRVVAPITSSLGLLGNPLYQHLIISNPTEAQLSEAIAGSIFGLQNFSGQPYSPDSVVALIHANLQNSAEQRVQGVDLGATYEFDASSEDVILLNATASYLDSKRQLIAGQPEIPVSGVIFTPPKWRAQASATWTHNNIRLSAAANYIGGTLDNRQRPDVRVASFLSFDLNARIESVADQGPLRNAELAVSIMNLANEKPDIIRNSSATDPTYDSVNYPAVGRRIAVTLTKRF